MIKKNDRAILVGLDLSGDGKINRSILELEKLAKANNIDTVESIIQKSDKISPRYYIGSGKVKEIKNMIDILNIDIVIFDDPLSPAQLSNLEKELDCQVIDRSFLILSIFADRAKSKESVLEVSLAQKQYMLPRLVGMGKSLSRQGGGTYNAKGPGETKLELDRRKLLDDITNIKKELKIIKKEKNISKKQRLENNIFIVALVGYTNVGKSSLMNSLSKKLHSDNQIVFEKDMLFATLDTKTKKLQKENDYPFLLIDTVGFVEKLPHELVNSFESTLSDVLDADLLLHVVDGAYYHDEQIKTTKDVLKRIGADDIDRLMVLTKKELNLPIPYIEEDYIFVSNKTLDNIDILIEDIYRHLHKESSLVTLLIPYEEGNLHNYFIENTKVINVDYVNQGYLIDLVLTKHLKNKFKKYIINKKEV